MGPVVIRGFRVQASSMDMQRKLDAASDRGEEERLMDELDSRLAADIEQQIEQEDSVSFQ